MSLKCRVIKGLECEVTYPYYEGYHEGIDLVNKGYTLGSIIAHSDGIVVSVRSDYYTVDKTGNSYGNYVKIKHDNGYYTLYAHLSYGSVSVKNGDRVKAGDVIGYMGATGFTQGAHLHFEVRNYNDIKINPTSYIDKDLPNTVPSYRLKYNVGDNVKINGIYFSSVSNERLTPAIDHGMITGIKESARNPYLLNEGYIGWANDDVIVGLYTDESILILVKKTIRGDFGNGMERKEKLGNNYQVVQNQVNLNFQNGTTNWDNIRLY